MQSTPTKKPRENTHTDYPQGKNYGKMAYFLDKTSLSTEKIVLIKIVFK